MNRIPAPALFLGLAGLLPFLWGGATAVSPLLGERSAALLGEAFTGLPLLVRYGTIILAFMAGVIWGFFAHEGGPELAVGLGLSVLPALWAFFLAPGPTPGALLALATGFVALLLIDRTALRRGLAPAWWMALRFLLTGVVVFCLALGYLFAP